MMKALSIAVSALVAAPVSAAAQTPAGKPITIGMIAEQSGALGFYGQETTRSAQIFVDQLNASGGLLGRPVQLIVRDSKTAVNEAVRQARDLALTENVDFLVHSFNSAECVGVANIAKQAKKILFSACANDDFTMRAGGRYIFRVPNITARTQGYAAADYAAQQLSEKGTRYYTIAHDFAFGRGVVDNFRERIKQKMPKVEFVGEAWPKLNEQSYAPFVTAMLNAKADVIFYSWGFGVPYWQQAAPFDVLSKVPMVSSYWAGSDDLQIVPKNSVPTGAIMGGLPWYAIEGKANEEFVARFRKAHDKPPLTAAYLVLMNLEALKAGIEKAGVVDTEKVADALEGLEFESVIGPIKIRAFDHQGTAPLWTGRAAWDEERKIGVLTEIVKLPTDLYLPSEDEVKKARQ